MRPSLLIFAVLLGAGALPAQEQRVQIHVLDPGEQGRDMILLAPGQSLGALERELTGLYLQLSPSLVEVRSRFQDGLEEREVITAGVVLSADGYVVAPVFQPSSESAASTSIWVRRVDGERFQGTLIARDARYGLALLQVSGLRGMQPRLFPGEFLMEGAPVVALGNAFGLESSMSLGILTGKGRQAGAAKRLLQVTNAVNPGDGGGLLANARGEVVGILLNSLPDLARAGLAVASGETDAEPSTILDEERARLAVGIGFAVPVEVVISLFPEQLGGLLRRSRMLGVEVERRLLVAETSEGPNRAWVLEVRSVLPGSAAAFAGIEAGDTFVDLAGHPVKTLEDLGFAIFTAPEKTAVGMLRAGARVDLPVDFSIRPLPPKPPPSQSPADGN